ncbi:MAG: GNAT family N-acetyltransferase [Xanthomonadaceae bacterium]|nr:GNAT family N-acetyltransferase [Xanthomonadaceae bacterium]
MVMAQTSAEVPELADDRLRLRPWRQDDAPALVAAARESTASVGRWLPWCHAGYGPDDAREWIAACESGWRGGKCFAFAIFDARSGALLGGIGLNQLNAEHRSANLGYWIRQGCQGHGFATAAVRLVARFGFRRLGLLRAEIVVLPQNLPSRRTAEKSGARFEGIARHRLRSGERARHAAVYALVEADLR